MKSNRQFFRLILRGLMILVAFVSCASNPTYYLISATFYGASCGAVVGAFVPNESGNILSLKNMGYGALIGTGIVLGIGSIPYIIYTIKDAKQVKEKTDGKVAGATAEFLGYYDQEFYEEFRKAYKLESQIIGNTPDNVIRAILELGHKSTGAMFLVQTYSNVFVIMYANDRGSYWSGKAKRDRSVDDAYFAIMKMVDAARRTGGYAMEIDLIDAVGNVMTYNESKQIK